MTNNTDREALRDKIACNYQLTYKQTDELIYLVQADIEKRVIEAVGEAVKQYGQNSVAYIHKGDENIKVIEAIKKVFSE